MSSVAVSIIDRSQDLTDEQACEWDIVVNSVPAGWFPREIHPILEQYCRHVVTARRVAKLVQSAESESDLDIGLLDTLYKMQDREGRAITSLATKMKILPQQTIGKVPEKGGLWDALSRPN